jgi:phosphopantothenoylcysteine decarboxylase/phosphopantothenate--cysteine ligase
MKKSPVSPALLKGRKILLIITGSIAAYKIPDLIQALREAGAKVTCVLTEAGKKFVTPLTLRAVSGEPVYDDFFTPHSPFDVIHTSLAEWGDLILVAPASANFIARLSVGLANDLASSILLAANRPVLLAPAMNDQMYRNPLTQENIKKLKGIGYHFVDPIEGYLICGKEALGHISEPETITRQAAHLLRSRPRV